MTTSRNGDRLEELIEEVERLRGYCEIIPILLGEIELLRAAALLEKDGEQ